MKLTTIWSIPFMTTTERLRRTRDWGAMKVAGKLPLRIRYWATILEVAKVTTGPRLSNVAVPDITLNDVLKNLDTPKDLK